MAKLKNPLFSLSALGALGKQLVIRGRGSARIVERKPHPTDAKTLAQLSWRTMFQKAIALWHTLNTTEQEAWERQATPRHMTGFAYFISQALKPNPGIYLPLAGGTMQGEIDMDSNKLSNLPDPTADQEAATKKYTDTGDWPLRDETEGDHFKQNASSSPPGWTETDAAIESRTNELFSYWYLRGTGADTSWDYRKQTGITIENIGLNKWASFLFGPILFRDGEYTADLNYLIGIYGETAGVIDLTKYVRVHLWWDSDPLALVWKVRGESNNGGGETASAWKVFTLPLNQPLYFRLMIRNTAAKACREYIGVLPHPKTHSLFQSLNETTTWGQVYWRISMSRGAGVNDYLFIGAVDYLINEP